ncbi:MAG: aldo/keto reductase [Opitutales bacterium]
MTTRPFPIAGLSRYVYGTTRLGDTDLPRESRHQIARRAIDAGCWFHTSRQYGEALEVLGEVFDEDRGKVPPLFAKIGHESLDELRDSIRDNLNPLGLETLEVGQLCLSGPYAQDLARGGRLFDDLQVLKEEGLVKHFVLEVFPWTSEAPYEGLKNGHGEGLIDAFIFYLNPLQRFADNRLWDLIRERNAPVIAMRTIGGAPVHTLRDVPGAAWVPYLQERAVEVAPIFERSGIEDWTEFCVRFAFSFPQVQATVGSTSRGENLDAFLRASSGVAVEPLPGDIVEELQALQYRWSDETDVKAEPWTM